MTYEIFVRVANISHSYLKQLTRLRIFLYPVEIGLKATDPRNVVQNKRRSYHLLTILNEVLLRKKIFVQNRPE